MKIVLDELSFLFCVLSFIKLLMLLHVLRIDPSFACKFEGLNSADDGKRGQSCVKQSGFYFVKIISPLCQFIFTIVETEAIVGMTRCQFCSWKPKIYPQSTITILICQLYFKRHMYLLAKEHHFIYKNDRI